MITALTEATTQDITEHHRIWRQEIPKIIPNGGRFQHHSIKPNEPPETNGTTICLVSIAVFYILAILLLMMSHCCRSKSYIPADHEVDVPPTVPLLANDPCESNREVTDCIDEIYSGERNDEKHSSGENMGVNSQRTLYTTNNEKLYNNNVMHQTTDAHDVPDTGLIAIRNDNVCATFITDDCDTGSSNDMASSCQNTTDDVTNTVRFTAELLRKVRRVMRKATSGRTEHPDDSRQNILTAGVFETEIV